MQLFILGTNTLGKMYDFFFNIVGGVAYSESCFGVLYPNSVSYVGLEFKALHPTMCQFSSYLQEHKGVQNYDL
jgi:hypothetical protein